MFPRIATTAVMLALALTISSPAHADEPAGAEHPMSGMFEAAADAPSRTSWDLYLSGHAHHGRSTYSADQLSKMNENTVGGGFGRTYRNRDGDDESLYVIGIRDSHERPQWMAGYAYRWIFTPRATGMEMGVGLTGLLVKRQDWFKGRPFPAILPVASLGARNAQLMATYVPPLPGKKKRGDILMLMFKLSM